MRGLWRAIQAVTEVMDLWGVYEQLPDADEMTSSSEAVSQINDTMTCGLIGNWGYRLQKAQGF